MTPKQKVLKKYPDSVICWHAWFSEFRVYPTIQAWESSIGSGKTEKAAWRAAERALAKEEK